MSCVIASCFRHQVRVLLIADGTLFGGFGKNIKKKRSKEKILTLENRL